MVDYKLRLGDGTTFSVDEKGLNTWLQGGLVDDKARIQPAGSKKWFSLKQVLAAQGEQRGHAVRQTQQGRADVDRQAAEEAAAIERRVMEQRAAEDRKAAEDLASAERKAAAQRSAAERKLIEEREAAERYAAEEAAEAEARAAAERQAEQERVEAERRAAEEAKRAADEDARAAEERMAAESAEAMAREAERIAEAEAKVAAERAERAARKRKAEEARVEAERQAAEAARIQAERVAAERAAAERKAAEDLAAEAARVAAAEKAVAAERAERAERKRRAEEERLAAERRAAGAAAEKAAAERDAAERAAAEAFRVDHPVAPPTARPDVEPPPAMVKVEEFERELALVPVGFDDDAEAASRGRAASPPVAANPSPAAVLSAEAEAATPKTAAAVLHGLVGGLKLIDRAVTSVAALFGRRGAAAARGAAEAPPVTSTTAPVVSAEPAPKVTPALKPVPPRPGPTPVAAGSQGAPPPWAAPPPTPWTPQVSATIPVKATPAAPPRALVTPPPSSKNLDVIPFATPAPAPRVTQDVWDGAAKEEVWEEPGRFSSALGNVWRWTRRAIVATALVGGAVVLALNREKWMPQAQDAATALGQGVDKLSERASSRTVSPRAVEAARDQIPYLRPATIELILSRSPVDLEPAEVFRRAHEAVERARPSIPAHVAAEIDNLTNAVASELDAGEGEHLRSYLGLLRAGTPTAAYQDKEAVWLMGRGVRRLSGEQRARMEELFAQAIAAALQPPAS